MYTVYLHRNVYNGKVYIGITSTKPSRRWKGGHGYESQSRFWNAIKKYGWKSFEHEILFEGLTKKEAEEKEVELIKQYKSNQREYGYNLSEGGGVNRGYSLSEETRRKLSKSKSNFIPWNKGLKGYKVPSAQGKKRSEETKQKMRDNRPKNSVVQLDMNGCFLNWYESMLDAEKKTGVRNSGISACCSGRYSQSGGYKWMLEKDFIGG